MNGSVYDFISLNQIFISRKVASFAESTSDQTETKLKNGITTKPELNSFVAKVERDGKHVCSTVLVHSKVALMLESCIDEYETYLFHSLIV